MEMHLKDEYIIRSQIRFLFRAISRDHMGVVNIYLSILNSTALKKEEREREENVINFSMKSIKIPINK